ncbi:hypothetical protein FKM82_028778 [Ascaphus truei]
MIPACNSAVCTHPGTSPSSLVKLREFRMPHFPFRLNTCKVELPGHELPALKCSPMTSHRSAELSTHLLPMVVINPGRRSCGVPLPSLATPGDSPGARGVCARSSGAARPPGFYTMQGSNALRGKWVQRSE